MDIFHEWEPVRLYGVGWYQPERLADGNVFRWVNDGAWLTIAQFAGVPYDLTLDVEPGPASGHESFELTIALEGNELARLTISGRQRIPFRLAGAEGGYRFLELRSDIGGEPVEAPGDDRKLKYRIFSIALVPVIDAAHLEQRIRASESMVVELRSAAAGHEGVMAATVAKYRREIEARDAIIERLELMAGRDRAEREELRSIVEDKHAEIERGAALAEERLAVIRALHEQGQRAAI